MTEIKKMAVVGAGTMGMGIAMVGAFAGLELVILDVAREKYDRNSDKTDLSEEKIFKTGMKDYDYKSIESSVKIGNWPEDSDLIKDCDLVIEAVFEDYDVKVDVANVIFKNTGRTTIVGTNTSNISIKSLSKDFPKEDQARYMGIHFFNPPYLMDLVEIIPHEENSEEILSKVKKFVKEKLNKKPLVANDVPGFLANRVGSFATTIAFNAAEEYNFDVQKTDMLLGEVMFRPRSGIYRLTDLTAIDLEYQSDLYFLETDMPDWEKEYRKLPERIERLYKLGKYGDKVGEGFFKKTTIDGNYAKLMWDFDKDEYALAVKEVIPALQETEEISDRVERLKTIFERHDKESKFIKKMVIETLWYCAVSLETVINRPIDAEIAMKDGYNWEVGPFELWNMLGTKYVADLIVEDGLELPKSVLELTNENKEFDLTE